MVPPCGRSEKHTEMHKAMRSVDWTNGGIHKRHHFCQCDYLSLTQMKPKPSE